MAIKHETELYAPLKAYFERYGYSIKGEVRTCDLVGLREGEDQPLIVEMKKTFNLALLLQGVERLRLSPNVYLAVERVRDKKGAVNQRWGELTGLCRRLGLGLITVVFYKTKAPLVEVLAEPGDAPPQVRSGARRREKLLYEFRERSGDYNTGGSTRVKLVTAYREKALRVALALQALEAEAALGLAAERGGRSAARGAGADAPTGGPAAAPGREGITPAELRRRSGVPGAAAILQRNYYRWFTRVNRGRYQLTPAGTAALVEYAAIAEISAGKG
ncbi:hypothetical protein R70723_09655 [Paenibacillus sp. FSL R7-0273]|uniref:DUF2161 family putative PD-(D/E)XK-type phosphodiesterase n=1 Tax=Paenibacillus sp. FSL R7-0273 TaxID=1536772 RepID=UPI0004F5ED10|nr:DUF2161 family putative PD-(D/E)XK-type phosphodiesterase [Paenibacillus sp. FSL R7-0273]AIQ46120.1 hypothetical protein R70723_09655 [Paenibacillus sp. FSL R7-0273]OMF92755.1 hypothetical protein BK144_12450 [Paenibacillus sp. FSL R7-0273]